MFKKLNLNLLGRSQMSTVLVQDRMRRLVDSGLRGSCRPAALTSKLKKRAKEMDDPTLTAMERVFFGFADKTRLKILKLLAGQELCACEVMAALGLTQPTTSHHLGIMERAGLVATRREGKWVFFRLADPRVETLLAKGTALVKGRP
jgi:ArsR family transcriptional regulator